MYMKMVTVTTFVAIALTLPLIFRKLRPRLRRIMAVELPVFREELLYDTEDLLQ